MKRTSATMRLPLSNLIVVLFVTVLAGCASMSSSKSEIAGEPEKNPPAHAQNHIEAHDNLNSVIWMQQSAEYKALVLQAYAQALSAIKSAKINSTLNALPLSEQSTLSHDAPLAIISDIDETLLDNSAFNARLIRSPLRSDLPITESGPQFKKAWKSWVAEAQAKPMVGASEFLRDISALGVRMFYITNREDDEKLATCENLRAIQFPLDDCASQVLTRNDAEGRVKEKGTRRKLVAQNYRVVALLGDNLGDFVDGIYGDHDTRDAIVKTNQTRWGSTWFFFPNPSYGSWEETIVKTVVDEPKAITIADRNAQLHRKKRQLLETQETVSSSDASKGFEK